MAVFRMMSTPSSSWFCIFHTELYEDSGSIQYLRIIEGPCLFFSVLHRMQLALVLYEPLTVYR